MGMPDAGGDDVEFGQSRLVRGTVAEVLVDGVDKTRLVIDDQ